MASSPLQPQRFIEDRRNELNHENKIANHFDKEYDRSVEFLNLAQSELFCDDPEKQYTAVCNLLTISNQYGFSENALPPIFFTQMNELLFGNNASIKYSEPVLQLIESIVDKSPWTVNSFLKIKYHILALENLKSGKLGLPPDRLAFTLNSLAIQGLNSYEIIMKMGYFDYLLKTANTDLCDFDILWVLTSIQTIITSDYFSQYELLNNVAKIALKYYKKIDSLNADTIALVFYLFSRCLAYDQLDENLSRRLLDDDVLYKAFQIIENKLIFDVRAAFDYVHNYVCVSNETTMKFIKVGFLQMFYNIFQICDYSSQISICLILSKVAIEPLEATLEVLKSPIIKFIPDILKTAKLALKKAALTLSINLIFKTPFASILDFLLQIFENAIELLACEDTQILEHSLHVIQYIISRIQTLDENQIKNIVNYFDSDLINQLYELTEYPNDNVKGMSINIITMLKTFQF